VNSRWDYACGGHGTQAGGSGPVWADITGLSAFITAPLRSDGLGRRRVILERATKLRNLIKDCAISGVVAH
jgi:hypothetical protein